VRNVVQRYCAATVWLDLIHEAKNESFKNLINGHIAQLLTYWNKSRNFAVLVCPNAGRLCLKSFVMLAARRSSGARVKDLCVLDKQIVDSITGQLRHTVLCVSFRIKWFLNNAASTWPACIYRKQASVTLKWTFCNTTATGYISCFAGNGQPLSTY